MTKTWIEAIDARSAAALATGALQPVAAEQTEMEDAGMRFIVRWVSSLAVKDAAKAATAPATPAPKADTPVAIPGGPRDPNFNPFLNPDPELTVGPIGTEHVVILNKFPLCERHLVLARRAFEEQLLPLARSDFAALAEIMREAGGIGLYNGGTAAGASQRHKHVQWIPRAEGNASLELWRPGVPADAAPLATAQHPQLAVRHCFVRIAGGPGVSVEALADSLHAGYTRALAQLGLAPDGSGLLPPSNLLIADGWLLLVPRSREHFEGVSVNALAFGGTFYAQEADKLAALKAAGPLAALAAVGV